MSTEGCYHCALPIPSGSRFLLTVADTERQFCCPGCQAVASAIVDGGLERFYQYRSQSATKADEQIPPFAVWDLPELQQEFVHLEGDSASVTLGVDGITCAACVWLIEKQLQTLDGIDSVRVNGTSHRMQLRWQIDRTPLSSVLTALARIGYRARPLTEESDLSHLRQQSRQQLLRLGIAGVAMMQAGMPAIALYFGAAQGIDAEWQQLLRWVSWLFVTPVVFYSAQPFFRAAINSLRAGHLVMDVPVVLAISLAYAASTWATLMGGGEVYFDSIAMFTFFLLLGRHIEAQMRLRNLNRLFSAHSLLPPSATVVTEEGDSELPLRLVQFGQRLRVDSGAVIPCDGVVVAGASEVSEAVLTGESLAVPKTVGDRVVAGTVNSGSPLEVEVTAIGNNTQMASILRMVEEAGIDKPHWVSLADRVASWFVAGVLVVSLVVGLVWWTIDPDHALWVVISVLVVTCPCALSLAMPTAMSVATGLLRRHGFLVSRGHVVEQLSQINQVLFDKTGTLTTGDIAVAEVVELAALPGQQLLQLAAALERGSHHPIARAFGAFKSSYVATEIRVEVGSGVEGVIDGLTYRVGSEAWVAELARQSHFVFGTPVNSAQSSIAIGGSNGLLGRFELRDQLRDGASAAVAELSASGTGVAMLSGDPSPGAMQIAAQLGISDARNGCSPAQKLNLLSARQQAGERVLMVGDGINDVPVLRAADISVAMGHAADLTTMSADAMLISGNLRVLPWAIRLSQQTRKIARQNIAWAIGYNLLALPLAAAGLVPPWAAAVGMSASSLVVLVNALRLRAVENQLV